MISNTHRIFAVICMAAAIFLFSSCATVEKPQGPYVTYRVSGKSVTVSSAVTYYDSDEKAREAFLKWFKRGFETVLAGEPPLMITWMETAEGTAGRRGYDFGMDEGERYLRNPGPPNSPHTVKILFN